MQDPSSLVKGGTIEPVNHLQFVFTTQGLPEKIQGPFSLVKGGTIEPVNHLQFVFPIQGPQKRCRILLLW
jgi:hypothetical protein